MDRDEFSRIFYGEGPVPPPLATDCPVKFEVWTDFRDTTTTKYGASSNGRTGCLECGLFRDSIGSLQPDRRHDIASAHSMCPSKPSDLAMSRQRSRNCA